MKYTCSASIRSLLISVVQCPVGGGSGGVGKSVVTVSLVGTVIDGAVVVVVGSVLVVGVDGVVVVVVVVVEPSLIVGGGTGVSGVVGDSDAVSTVVVVVVVVVVAFVGAITTGVDCVGSPPTVEVMATPASLCSQLPSSVVGGATGGSKFNTSSDGGVLSAIGGPISTTLNGDQFKG